MRARHKIHVRHLTVTGEDGFGNPVTTLGDPEEVRVYSIGPAYSTESERLVQTGLTIGSPSDYGITSGDVLVIKGSEWQVEGEVVDCNLGPWDYAPGYVITVKRAEQ